MKNVFIEAAKCLLIGYNNINKNLKNEGKKIKVIEYSLSKLNNSSDNIYLKSRKYLGIKLINISFKIK